MATAVSPVPVTSPLVGRLLVVGLVGVLVVGLAVGLMVGLMVVVLTRVRISALGEDAVDGPAQFHHQKRADQAVVDEPGLLQRQPHTQDGVVAQFTGPVEPGAGGREWVPGTLAPVLLTVLHRVQQVGDAAEQASRLAQGFGIGGPPRQDGGVRERQIGRAHV